LRSLEIFRSVAVEGSVTKAAAKLNRVQSNVSTRIKQLETQLGKSLFRRENRGLTLTADGRLLLSYAGRLLQLADETTDALNDGKPHGVFRIGTMESTAAARLPAILSRYHQLYPDVKIELETDTAGGLFDRLLNRDIEIAFVAEPISFESLESRPVFEEQLPGDRGDGDDQRPDGRRIRIRLRLPPVSRRLAFGLRHCPGRDHRPRVIRGHSGLCFRRHRFRRRTPVGPGSDLDSGPVQDI
jgi:DNA-binding transcriptional LysR family regulator